MAVPDLRHVPFPKETSRVRSFANRNTFQLSQVPFLQEIHERDALDFAGAVRSA
jgi:hypothetical protein